MPESSAVGEALSSFASSLSALFSSPVLADEGKDDGADNAEADGDDAGDAADADGSDGAADEEEEEEPEDPMPAIRESCENGPCSKVKHHFEECEKRVSAGKGFKGEDCVEELFHMLHCVDSCSSAKVFAATR